MARRCGASCDRISESFCGPGVIGVRRSATTEACSSGENLCSRSENFFSHSHLSAGAQAGAVVGIAEVTREHLVARISHAAQIDLRFGNLAREVSDFGAGVGPGNLVRERFHLFGQGWIEANRQVQPVTQCVPRRASAAMARIRTGAGPRIGAVSLNFALAGQT